MPINKSISDLLYKTQETLEFCKQKNEPIFFKENENEELVIMSSQYFNRLWELLIDFELNQLHESSFANQSFHVNSLDEIYQKLDEAEQDVQEGKTFTHEEVMARLEERLVGKL
jgi:PHD/YefM family antitoxin component YafN of YafNO toxin-antitoxin module